MNESLDTRSTSKEMSTGSISPASQLSQSKTPLNMPISNNPRNSKEFVALLRGQVAVEFLVYVSVFMLAVVLAFFVINQSQQAELPAKQNALAKETGQGFVDVLSLSVRAGAGFEYRYQFPKTLLNHPYSVNFAPLTPSNLMFFDWPGEYADFNYSYRLPTYKYLFSGRCLSDGVLHSNACDNVLVLRNDGENITLLQEEGSS